MRRTAAAWLVTGAPGGRAASSRARSARTRGRPASRPRSAPPHAPRSASGQRRARVLGAAASSAQRRRPGGRLGARHRDGVGHAAVAVPVGRDRLQPRRRRTRPRSNHSRYSLLGREQHPGSASARAIRPAGRTGPITTPTPPGAQHAVGLGDPALRVGPVLDAAGRHVAVERVVLERQRLGVAEQPPARRPARGGGRRARAGAGSGRASSRCAGSTCATIPSVVKPVPAPASSVSRSRRSRRAAASARVAHARRPEQRVDPVVVAEREEPVEPVRLLLVLDQPHASRRRYPPDRPTAWTRGCRTRRAHAPPPRRADSRPRTSGGAANELRLSDTRTLGRLVRWRIPGLARDLTYGELFRAYPFTVLEEGEQHLLAGLCGRIWTLARDYPRLGGPGRFAALGRARHRARAVRPLGRGRTATARALVSEARVRAGRPHAPACGCGRCGR